MSYTIVLNSNNRANPTETATNAIYNFNWDTLEEGEYKVNWKLYKIQNNYRLYLNYKIYLSYHTENPTFTDITTSNGSGYSQNIIDLATGVNNTLPTGTTTSVLWTGYFFTGSTPTGSYTFFIMSDDGSYLWIGNNATANYTVTNAFINNGGGHAPLEKQASMIMTTNTYYPIRILYGDSGGGRDMLLSFTPPDTLIKTSNGSGRYFS